MQFTDDSNGHKALVDNFLQAFSSGNVAAIGKHLHAEFQWWVAGRIPGVSGTYDQAQMVTLLGHFTTVYKQGALQVTPSRMICEGDVVAVEAEPYAELKSGKVYHNFNHSVFEIADGKIKVFKEYLDTLHIHETFIATGWLVSRSEVRSPRCSAQSSRDDAGLAAPHHSGVFHA